MWEAALDWLSAVVRRRRREGGKNSGSVLQWIGPSAGQRAGRPPSHQGRQPVTNRANVNADLLRWARERAGFTTEDLATQFPRLSEWERGDAKPTFRQLEAFARATFAPFGYLFLDVPPEEEPPIPHYRTASAAPGRPSPHLLDTLYALQRRQTWMRNHLISEGHSPLSYVDSASVGDPVPAVVAKMRRVLGLRPGWTASHATWQKALTFLRNRMTDVGVFVAVNSVVGNNTRRKLDVSEFRGFVLTDEYAPFVFVNGRDAKAAQMFTLAHELAHVFFGTSASFDLRRLQSAKEPVEQACNQVAAEFLVPEGDMRAKWPDAESSGEPFQFLARRFKVSTVVVARRALDVGLIQARTFRRFYREWQRELKGLREKSIVDGGGDFYATQSIRLCERFARTVISAAKNDTLSYRSAYRLTGLYGRTFEEYSSRLGIGDGT